MLQYFFEGQIIDNSMPAERASTNKSQQPQAMVVTDLDGTLLNSAGRLSRNNMETLQSLAAENILRVAATGRSLWSAQHVIAATAPLDYLLFSSGSGIVDWPVGELLHSRQLSCQQALGAASILRQYQCDFMLHAAIPDNHQFWYHRSCTDNPDFEDRIQRHLPFCRPWRDSELIHDTYTQLLVVQPAQHLFVRRQQLAAELAPLSVIRATSPLDHVSTWFEVFPPQVSKASGVRWLAERAGLHAESVLVVGNDYNDIEMLEWAHHASVVANAPDELRQRYGTVPNNDEDGFSAAVQNWLAEKS